MLKQSRQMARPTPCLLTRPVAQARLRRLHRRPQAVAEEGHSRRLPLRPEVRDRSSEPES